MPSPTLPDDKGMSLRDWFAGQALAGAMASEAYDGKAFEFIVVDCLAIADAMLAARARGK